MRRRKLLILLAALLANVICTILVFTVPIETTAIKVWGSYAAILLVAVAAWRFPSRFYLLAMAFVFLASTLGSCINFYRHMGFYDLFVHYVSGIVLAEGGYILMEALLRKRGLHDDFMVKVLFAAAFSCACAGFWEIYEFTADCLINTQMQGSKINTMGDIISGVLGAATYFVVAAVKKKLMRKTN